MPKIRSYYYRGSIGDYRSYGIRETEQGLAEEIPDQKCLTYGGLVIGAFKPT